MSTPRECFNKKEFKLLLDKLLNVELEKLRRKFWAYKRRPFLKNKVEIRIGKYRKNVAGCYENTRKNDRQFKYMHKIYITKNQVSTYARYVRWHMKRVAIAELKALIRHELIHAFIFEEFEMWEEIKNTHGDYSPIFLSCLYWCNGNTHHRYTDKFLETELWKEIRVCKSYWDVYIKLMRFITNLEKCVDEINRDINTNPHIQKGLSIEFNNREPGIVKRAYLSSNIIEKQDSNVYKYKAIIMTLGLGFLVTPDTLKESYQRKFDNGALAEIHSEEVAYAKENEIKYKSNIRSNIV